MRLVALFALLTLAAAEDLSPPDYVRSKFYALEEELWRNVTDPLWREAGLGGDVELTKSFVVVDNQIEMIPRSPRPPLRSWLWTKALEKMQIIDGLYKNFVQFVRRQAVPGTVPAPVKEWLDLAEAVLMDPKTSAAQAVRKLHDLLEHGDMFRSILQVQEEASDLSGDIFHRVRVSIGVVTSTRDDPRVWQLGMSVTRCLCWSSACLYSARNNIPHLGSEAVSAIVNH